MTATDIMYTMEASTIDTVCVPLYSVLIKLFISGLMAVFALINIGESKIDKPNILNLFNFNLFFPLVCISSLISQSIDLIGLLYLPNRIYL